MPPARPRSLLALLLVLLLVVAACSEADLDVSSGSSGRGGNGDGGGGRRGLPDQDDMDVEIPEDLELEALEDIENFWSEEYPRVYGDDFEAVSGGFVPYGPDTNIPDCGPQELDYELAANNAFYCTFDDYIAWDDVGLLADVEEDYGPLAAGVIMAHEYGHAIQERADLFNAEPIITELQADCFAGAWASDVNGRIPFFTSEGGNLEAAVAGFIELLRDVPGSDPTAPTAHGSAFDRVSAFQDGYDAGTEECATYPDDNPVITQMPFQSAEDAANEGNLPTDQLVQLLPVDLESFYTALFEQVDRDWDSLDDIEFVDPDTDEVDCDGDTFEDEELEYFSLYCGEDDTIYVDAAELLPDLEDIGDMAVGGEIARLYAIDAQRQLGISAPGDELARHADCLTGVFISAMFTETIPDQQLVLSSGDFDEIVVVFLVFSEPSDEISPVDRVSDFRRGFLEGINSCDELVN